MNAKCKIYNLVSIIQLTLLIPTYEARQWPKLSKKVHSIDLVIKPRSSK